MSWLLQNIVGIAGILVGGFIAYHVYFLSRKIDFKEGLAHRDQVRDRTNSILRNRGYGKKVELINTKKYATHYPENNEEDRNGYTYIGAELKTPRFDGVEFFSSMPIHVYEDPDGNYHKTKRSPDWKEKLVFPVGLVPYDWIEYVDERGDEMSYRPQFFVKFKGPKKHPYKAIAYYELSTTYHEGSDPEDWKYRGVEVLP